MGDKSGFFMVDRRAWARACGLGIPAAVSYLVMARGTLRDQRTTAWSVNAIEERTGIGRRRARKAVEALISSGLVRQDRGGSHPSYFLQPPHEVPGCEGHPQPISEEEQRILNLIAAGYNSVPKVGRYDNVWEYGNPYKVACGLARKGRLRDRGGHYFEVIAEAASGAASEPDWIWLPNAIIDGAAGETPPVELVRQSQNATALRLFIDLYHSHALADDGGIHWRRIRETYERVRVGQRGPLVVWGIKKKTVTAWPDAPFIAPHMTGKSEPLPWDKTQTRDSGFSTFWPAWEILTTLGLVELVAHVIEADTADGEILHPYALGNGEPIERRIMAAAHAAGQLMLTPDQKTWAESKGWFCLPLQAHFENVAVVGIARLRYRPRTKATAAWIARQEDWDAWATRYDELREALKAQNENGSQVADVQHQW